MDKFDQLLSLKKDVSICGNEYIIKISLNKDGYKNYEASKFLYVSAIKNKYNIDNELCIRLSNSYSSSFCCEVVASCIVAVFSKNDSTENNFFVKSLQNIRNRSQQIIKAKHHYSVYNEDKILLLCDPRVAVNEFTYTDEALIQFIKIVCDIFENYFIAYENEYPDNIESMSPSECEDMVNNINFIMETCGFYNINSIFKSINSEPYVLLNNASKFELCIYLNNAIHNN